MNILAIGAHPDDLELYCYGTLAKYIQQGHHVVTCSIANGNLGHYEIMPDDLAKIRKEETTNAAQLIGAEYIGIDIGDMKVNAQDTDVQRKMVELIRSVKPNLIITHNPDDYMPDHVETSKLVFYASFGSSIPNYRTETVFYEAVVPIYYMETAMGIGFIPQEYVDISETIDIKVQALKCHKSQLQWLDDHDGFDIVHYAGVMGEYRGVQCNAKYAEGFRKCECWPRLTSNRMLP